VGIREEPLFQTAPVFQGRGARVEEKQQKGPATGLVGKHRIKNLI